MRSTKLPLALATVMFASAIFVSSCRKKEAEDTDLTEASDHTLAEHSSNDIISIGSQASDNNSGNLSSFKMGNGGTNPDILSTCATIKRDSINKVDSVIFNNSSCMDGKVRNGVLIYNYSASTNGAKHYRDPGFNCSVTSSNYSVDGNAINVISKTIVNTTAVGFNPSSTNLTWSINSHIQIVKSTGTLDFSQSRTKTLLNTSDPNVYHGSATAISWNLAKVGITGSASGTTVKGTPFTAQVTSQLIRDFSCSVGGRHPFIQGTLEFTPGTKAPRTIDFGSGDCDLMATVTIKGKSHQINLK